MNLRKIELDLTVALINNHSNEHAPKLAKAQLQQFQEVGKFLGTELISKKAIGKEQLNRRYAIKFEHCTLTLHMISNGKDYPQVVNSFRLSGTEERLIA
ncbi:MAG: hypothetical protein KDC34_04165 [Saprospiraceae bacterium]|nr:hypothetical protein [Saprospiraceae bacterium]